MERRNFIATLRKPYRGSVLEVLLAAQSSRLV